MYVFYGVEIPKTWTEWPSAFGNLPRTITSRNIEVDVPNIGGEPVLIKGKAVVIDDFELTLYRYPHDQEDVVGQEYLGILGFLICEIDQYADPTDAFKRYQEWQHKYATMSNFDVMLQDICKVLEVNYTKPYLQTCAVTCTCC